MTVYNINLGIGWASSGVEYAQAYRASVLRKLGIKAKFIFMDYFNSENLADLTTNIGFKNEEVLWLYTAFSDLALSQPSISIAQFKEQLGQEILHEQILPRQVVLQLANNLELRLHLSRLAPHCVSWVEYLVAGKLQKKAYYTSQLSHEEVYGDKQVSYRQFYNQDGSVALTEMLTAGKASLYRTKDQVFYSKEELIAAFMKKLGLTAQDIVILDRETGIGQVIFENVRPAKLGVVVHAEHFSESSTNADYILWNNYYDYQFTNAKWVDFFVVATSVQQEILTEQLRRYNHHAAKVYTIPVGSLAQLKEASEPRRMWSLVTASRLASEKHLDWLIEAVVKAKQVVTDLSLDIYGEGNNRAKLAKEIEQADANAYIRLKGHQDLSHVYTKYEAYISASTSEGFGLTLLEALGSGLPLIGLDVRYGNQTFIDDGQNGYLLNLASYTDKKAVVAALSQAIIKLFTQADLATFSKHSYEKAAAYLDSEIETKWEQLVSAEVGAGND